MATKGQQHAGKRPKVNVDESIVAALVMGASYQSAAQHAGVSPTTVFRRVKSPAFQRKLLAARQEITRQSIDKASFYGNMALNTLMRLLESENDAVALGSARSLCEIVFKMRETADFEERLAQIESELGGDEGRMRLHDAS
jgi:hypothetical protein